MDTKRHVRLACPCTIIRLDDPSCASVAPRAVTGAPSAAVRTGSRSHVHSGGPSTPALPSAPSPSAAAGAAFLIRRTATDVTPSDSVTSGPPMATIVGPELSPPATTPTASVSPALGGVPSTRGRPIESSARTTKGEPRNGKRSGAPPDSASTTKETETSYIPGAATR